jgi:secreted PhoX family phosphatase
VEAVRISRRGLVAAGLAGAGLVSLGKLASRFAGGPSVASPRVGLGPLIPDPDGLLDLPRGFRYRVVSATGDALPGGGVVPGWFDGMAAFHRGRDSTVLVRNHEQATAGVRVVAAPELTYDPGAWGGTTTVVLDRGGRRVDQRVSLAGTSTNCAGGTTPWGSWLTCEETDATAGSAGGAITRDHGFVFEVDAWHPSRNVDPTPLTALGRFPHEAVAVDPRTGVVYLTEDATGPNGLLYRLLPERPLGGYGSLRAGGALQALRCTDGGSSVPDLSAYTVPGTVLGVGWAAIPDPLAATTPTRRQLDEATRSRKFEGAWWSRGRVYVVASFARHIDGSAGEHDGQVWCLDPESRTLTLDVHFALTPDRAGDPDGPDNLTSSPWGGLILCEDGEGAQHLYAAGRDGTVAPLARNRRDGGEFAGATFGPGGRTMYVNLQDPGTTFAITGPFGER